MQHFLNDDAFGYLERVKVTAADHHVLLEVHAFNIQSTGQKSHCVGVMCVWRVVAWWVCEYVEEGGRRDGGREGGREGGRGGK